MTLYKGQKLKRTFPDYGLITVENPQIELSEGLEPMALISDINGKHYVKISSIDVYFEEHNDEDNKLFPHHEEIMDSPEHHNINPANKPPLSHTFKKD